MPVIRITDNTLDRMKKVAVPLEDTHDSVINRLLDHYAGNEASNGNNRHLPPKDVSRPILRIRKKKLPQKQFEIPVLEVISELGGSADVRLIKDPLLERIKEKLLEGDYDLVSSGDPRWWNAACWARNELKVKGLIKPDSPRGVWELTEKGKEYLESCRNLLS